MDFILGQCFPTYNVVDRNNYVQDVLRVVTMEDLIEHIRNDSLAELLRLAVPKLSGYLFKDGYEILD